MQHIISRVIRLVTMALVVAAILPGAVWAEESQAAVPTAAVSGELTVRGGWIAYAFPYAGDQSGVHFTLSYSPADSFTDQAVLLDGYSPADPPPNGTAIGSAAESDQAGVKHWNFSSDLAGTYVVIVRNWDFLERAVQFTLTSTNTETGAPGPALTFLSSGPSSR